MQNILLIIDPFLKQPSSDGINVISKLHFEVLQESKNLNSYIEVFFPSHPDTDKTLKDYFLHLDRNNKRIIGVISLGSYANITENYDWVVEFGKDLKEHVIEKNIPFLGICFSHQLFAWIYGATIDYVENRENIPGKKYNEFREISVLHPRIKSIIGNINSFISKSKHEQEVKSIVPEFLEVTCTSKNCKIEGLIHKSYPSFSIQSHPEEFHESRDGWKFVKNFISYFILNSEKRI
ncbi:MAG: gamma-glutamyl-gamma-aminobutyrate hydrolase family protein [Leptospiraceae bacterium]|nr:gamma-glutamyl-gamma-aminobutyrate hydrolase family protein [Leptospiraceae bacterium]